GLSRTGPAASWARRSGPRVGDLARRKRGVLQGADAGLEDEQLAVEGAQVVVDALALLGRQLPHLGQRSLDLGLLGLEHRALADRLDHHLVALRGGVLADADLDPVAALDDDDALLRADLVAPAEEPVGRDGAAGLAAGDDRGGLV